MQADLMIQVSDRVKQTEQQRLGRAHDALEAFPYQMVGGVLRHRPPPAILNPLPAPVHPRYVPAPPVQVFEPIVHAPHHQHIPFLQPYALHQANQLRHAQEAGRQAVRAPPPLQQLPVRPGEAARVGIVLGQPLQEPYHQQLPAQPGQLAGVGVASLQPLQAPHLQQQYVARHFFAQQDIGFRKHDQNHPDQDQKR